MRSLGPLFVALLALAVFGSPAAGAAERWESTLCESPVAECPNEVALPFELEASGDVEVSFVGLPTVECSSSSLSISAEEESGELGEVSGLTMAGCSEGCSVTAKNLPYGAELVALGETPKFIEGNGHIPIEDGGGGEPRFELNCGSATCVYADSGQPFYFKAGGEITANKWGMPRKSGDTFLCPSAMSMTAALEVTDPSPSYATLRGGPSAFCEVDAQLCPKESTYPVGTSLFGQLSEGAKATFKASSFTEKCSTSSFEGETVEEQSEQVGRGLMGEVTSMAFGECSLSSSCLSFEALNLPYQFEVFTEKGVYPEWKSVMLLEGVEIKASCFPNPCFYEAAGQVEVELSSNGGAMKAVLGPEPLVISSGFPCPPTFEWSGEYDLTPPEPLYATQH